MAATQSQPAQREKQLHELLSRDLVDIYVGSENTHWILHEKLLCYRSKFFAKIFYSSSESGSNKVFGLPDEEDEPFRLFVGWLYSGYVPAPKEEKDLGALFDLYLMGEKWQIAGLVKDVLGAVRHWYKSTDTYPGLRRVQYIYANTDESSDMRRMLVHSVARMLALRDDMPQHWDKALRKNGQLAVDVIRSIQEWHIDPSVVPDARDEQTETEKGKNDEKMDKKAEEVAEKEIKGEEQGQGQDQSQEKEKEKEIKKEPQEDKEHQTNGMVNGVDHHSDEDH
ncbi:hypothetical protein H2201_004470 [Coniosporium apollinis]|uniref:BTB domain-containing protein n=1 Tax=Coniosporium apollinis TaxID=61459 RepID=A0ABQ9NXT0_9PEZI|nr:hypothetical protein H2201_004470 [Coniosporium apollinis]